MFTIRLETLLYRPDLQITLRNASDGWNVDVPGHYQDDAWVFRLSEQQYAGGLEFKFVLEKQYWMLGGNLRLQPAAGATYQFDATTVQFPAIDELLVENGYISQRFFAPNTDESHHYDVIVIGSGMGGGILADQLSDLGLDVLVLEAGSYLLPTHVGNLPRQHALARRVDKSVWSLWDDFRVVNYVNADGSAYAGGQGFNLGGRSLFWGGFIPPMTTWELETWPPVVRRYLEDRGNVQAQELLKVSEQDSDYQWKVKGFLNQRLADYSTLNAPMALQTSSAMLRTVAAGIFSTADLLMESRLTEGVTGRKNLTINLNHPVVRLETSGRQCTGVVAHDLLSNRQRSFTAHTVVLCAGTVESAKLAMLSKLNDPNQKIGVGITDHPIFFTHFAVPASSPLYESGAAAKVLLRHKHAGLNTPPPHQNDHRYNVILEMGADFNQGRFIDPDILREHLRIRRNSMLCEVVFLFNTLLSEENSLQQTGPSYVKPVVNMRKIPISAQEWQEINAFKDQLIEQLGGEPLENDSLALKEAVLGGVAHEVGTLRMGTRADSNFQDGVVDPNLKFLAYDNVYACDLSVFPTSPAANPSLTLAALALRLAEHLREQLPQ